MITQVINDKGEVFDVIPNPVLTIRTGPTSTTSFHENLMPKNGYRPYIIDGELVNPYQEIEDHMRKTGEALREKPKVIDQEKTRDDKIAAFVHALGWLISTIHDGYGFGSDSSKKALKNAIKDLL